MSGTLWFDNFGPSDLYLYFVLEIMKLRGPSADASLKLLDAGFPSSGCPWAPFFQGKSCIVGPEMGRAMEKVDGLAVSDLNGWKLAPMPLDEIADE